jgi:hypothetical protein
MYNVGRHLRENFFVPFLVNGSRRLCEVNLKLLRIQWSLEKRREEEKNLDLMVPICIVMTCQAGGTCCDL